MILPFCQPFKKLTSTSSVTTMLVFNDAFITDLHRLDLYHYTFAGLAGLLRLEQVQDEPTLLGTENVIRAVMKITPNHLKTNSSFRRELRTELHYSAGRRETCIPRLGTLLHSDGRAR